MRIVRLLACFAYWVFLTVLLLVADPAAIVGLRRIPVFPWGDHGIHFAAFTVLSILTHGTRWPQRPSWLVIVLLLGYGMTAESLQAFVPPRTVELLDYVANGLGVMAGSGLYWFFQGMMAQRRTQANLLAAYMNRTTTRDAANE